MNIDVNVNDHNIEIKAEQKKEKEVKQNDKGFYSYYASCSSFYRKLPLSAKVSANKTEASYKDGVLNITLPKQKTEKAKEVKKIEIK